MEIAAATAAAGGGCGGDAGIGQGMYTEQPFEASGFTPYSQILAGSIGSAFGAAVALPAKSEIACMCMGDNRCAADTPLFAMELFRGYEASSDLSELACGTCPRHIKSAAGFDGASR